MIERLFNWAVTFLVVGVLLDACTYTVLDIVRTNNLSDRILCLGLVFMFLGMAGIVLDAVWAKAWESARNARRLRRLRTPAR